VAAAIGHTEKSAVASAIITIARSARCLPNETTKMAAAIDDATAGTKPRVSAIAASAAPAADEMGLGIVLHTRD